MSDESADGAELDDATRLSRRAIERDEATRLVSRDADEATRLVDRQDDATRLVERNLDRDADETRVVDRGGVDDRTILRGSRREDAGATPVIPDGRAASVPAAPGAGPGDRYSARGVSEPVRVERHALRPPPDRHAATRPTVRPGSERAAGRRRAIGVVVAIVAVTTVVVAAVVILALVLIPRGS